MKYSWQIQRSQWAIQVGGVGQFTNHAGAPTACGQWVCPWAVGESNKFWSPQQQVHPPPPSGGWSCCCGDRNIGLTHRWVPHPVPTGYGSPCTVGTVGCFFGLVWPTELSWRGGFWLFLPHLFFNTPLKTKIAMRSLWQVQDEVGWLDNFISSFQQEGAFFCLASRARMRPRTMDTRSYKTSSLSTRELQISRSLFLFS